MPDARLLAFRPRVQLTVQPVGLQSAPAADELQSAAANAVLGLFPQAEVLSDGVGKVGEDGASLHVTVTCSGAGLVVTGVIQRPGRLSVQLTDVDYEISTGMYSDAERHQRMQERVKGMVHKLLSTGYGVDKRPWGILVGVRPTKLVHKYLDRSIPEDKIRFLLKDVYQVREDKVRLVLDVALRQRSFFSEDSARAVSVYVGIPFCPTRCRYCSFAAYPLTTHKHLVEGFFQALLAEIEAVGTILRDCGLSVQSWYIGGGTPTILTAGQLDTMITKLHQFVPTPTSGEFTVEAGRPDTITAKKLRVLKDLGVNRISINPQTMQQRTLDAVGRCHSVGQVVSAFEMARNVGFPIVNADLIIGLVGETAEDVADTLEQMGRLEPENLTVHSLAVKRASTWRSEAEHLAYPDRLEVEKMAALARRYATQHGLHPYYLYRQRYIVGDLENIGYAKPGTESVYNIQMMEERQTILALGGGGISKFIYGGDRVQRVPNPKCPATYAQSLRDLIAKKEAAVAQWLSHRRGPTRPGSSC